MTDTDFKTPQPGDWVDIEIPGGWDVLYATGAQQPALTDERILAIAKRHRNHTLTAQSGTKFDVIEHKDLVAFAREIEGAVFGRQVRWRARQLPVIACLALFANFGHLSFASLPRQP